MRVALSRHVKEPALAKIEHKVYASAQECLRRRLPLTRIYEVALFDDPIAAPELLRLLMDDCGFRIEAAYVTVTRSCASIFLTEQEQETLSSLQPRTARLSELLRRAKDSLLSIEHDASLKEYRDPPRALRCGETVKISFRLLSDEKCSYTI